MTISVMFLVIPNQSIDVPFDVVILFLVGNSLLGGLLILFLHILFPEAVLSSYEQIIRAYKMYKLIPRKGVIPKLGISTINNYLENAKEFLTKEEISSSSLI